MMTSEQLAKLGINPDWLLWLQKTFERYSIDNTVRQSAFIGQCMHESANFKVLQENLNYSANGLKSVWSSRFSTDEIANKYARHPDMIANKVYANRMGNGDEESGDGWKYRGRGLIQCTGKDLYKTLSDVLNIDLINNPDLLQEMPFASMSAGWFWNKKGLNALADAKDYKEMTKRINGGFNGLDDRIAKINKAMEVLTA
jgi:putative chitinase